jgi:hypothetical protein
LGFVFRFYSEYICLSLCKQYQTSLYKKFRKNSGSKNVFKDIIDREIKKHLIFARQRYQNKQISHIEKINQYKEELKNNYEPDKNE